MGKDNGPEQSSASDTFAQIAKNAVAETTGASVIKNLGKDAMEQPTSVQGQASAIEAVLKLAADAARAKSDRPRK
jgi:hypothetical protein